MNSYHVSCYFEDDNWQLRVIEYTNTYLFLYEIEPEDRKLLSRFGVKFITQPREGFLDIRCTNSVKEHLLYEQAIIACLEHHLMHEQ